MKVTTKPKQPMTHKGHAKEYYNPKAGFSKRPSVKRGSARGR